MRCPEGEAAEIVPLPRAPGISTLAGGIPEEAGGGMAKARRSKRRHSRKKRATARQWAGFGTVTVLSALALGWSSVWPLVVGIAGLGAVGGAARWLWVEHRRATRGDQTWRAGEERRARELTMKSVDALTWQEFERYVADLCRRDGCTEVMVSGKAGDLGADVIGLMADGRKLVIQCKHYAPHRKVPSGDMQKFVGTARLEHRADVALFVATCGFTKEAGELALRQGICAMHRDLLGSWVKGARLDSLLPLNGAGGGGRARHRS